MRDLYHKLEQKILALPQVITSDLTPAAGVELNQCEAVNFDAVVGANGATLDSSNYVEIILEDSADDTTYAAVTTAKYVMGLTPSSLGVVATIDGATDDEQTYRCGYLGPKRFARIRAKVTGAGVSIPIALLAEKGYLNRNGI